MTLKPWFDKESGWSQEPFLAAPEGYGTRVVSDATYHAFVSGLGAGKTVAGIMRVVANAESWNPGELGMILGPTVPHIKNTILPEMRKWGLLEDWEFKGKGSDEPGLHTPNGARIILESADNDRKIERLRGPSLAWFWIDEAALLPEKVWKIMTARLRAGNYRNAFITTTPRGYNWVYRRFYTYENAAGEVVEGAPPNVNLVYGVPSGANPHNPSEYAEDLSDEYQGHFREQEVHGLFVQPEGLVYPWFRRQPPYVVSDIPSNPDRFYYGMDFGHRNPSAIIAVMQTRTNEHVVVETFYEPRVTDKDLSERVKEMYERWGPGPVYADPSEPAAIDQLKRDGIDAVKATNDIIPGIKTVTGMGKRQELSIHESCEPLIQEIRQYHYDEDNEKDEPVKQNDHACDGLRYALHTDQGSGSHNIGVTSGDLY